MSRSDVHPRQDQRTGGWWVVAAWGSLVLVLAGGLAGAAGLAAT